MPNFNFIPIVLAIAILSNIGDAAVFRRIKDPQDRANCPDLTGKLDLDYNQVYISIHSIDLNHSYYFPMNEI